MLLSKTELEELTDRKRAKEQIAWLVKRGYRFEIGGAGRVKVLRAEVERHMLSGPGSASRIRREINLAAV